MTQVVTPPGLPPYGTPYMPSVFIAGGIVGCPDWQTELIAEIGDVDAVIYNPRREHFPQSSDKSVLLCQSSVNEQMLEQITWEYNRLREASIISFWFSRGSVNPIVLYELGMWGNSRNTPIVVGMDDEYTRKDDVVIQTKLARPESLIHTSLHDMATAIRSMLKSWEA